MLGDELLERRRSRIKLNLGFRSIRVNSQAATSLAVCELVFAVIFMMLFISLRLVLAYTRVRPMNVRVNLTDGAQRHERCPLPNAATLLLDSN